VIFKKAQEILTISVDQENLTSCSWNLSNDKLTFHVVYQYQLEHAILNLIIFNYTKIENVIKDFLEQNKIDNPKVYLSLDSSLLDECLFNNSHDQEDNVNYEQICLDQDKQLYYRVGIKQVLLFQYQLLFMKHVRGSFSGNGLKLNLIKISTDLVSLLNINNQNYYKKSLSVNEFKNNILNSINFDFGKYITNMSAIENLDKLTLIKSIGLFLSPGHPDPSTSSG